MTNDGEMSGAPSHYSSRSRARASNAARGRRGRRSGGRSAISSYVSADGRAPFLARSNKLQNCAGGHRHARAPRHDRHGARGSNDAHGARPLNRTIINHKLCIEPRSLDSSGPFTDTTMLNPERESACGSGCRRASSFATMCHLAPRRMFLCEVPLFTKQASACDGNLLRLMGTVVELIPTSSCDASPAANAPQTLNNGHDQTKELICFVIDDGTGTICVYTWRRVKESSNCNDDAPFGEHSNHAMPRRYTQNKMSAQQHLQPSSASAATLESILSSPQPSISVGQAVDCIGRIHADAEEGLFADNGVLEQAHTIWLAASSVSIVNNPQSVTLRQLELASSKRLRASHHATATEQRGAMLGNNSNPKNLILVGGDLERKLNPLYHCNRQDSVVFDLDSAFRYIKHSKDDGGITTQEIASLVGALEPNEKLAVNLAVEQLREDCRIYLNQGKWFPM